MHDLSADGRLMLGTVGWERDDWLDSYYPPDLPPEWRPAYYANDCGCVLLTADFWCGMDPELLAEALDELGGRLQFFLEQPPGCPEPARARLSLFASSPAILLVDRPHPGCSLLPQWISQGSGVWVDTDSGASLLSWPLAVMNLRELRIRAETLPASVRALVLDGPAASPGRVPELRTLLELMGMA